VSHYELKLIATLSNETSREPVSDSVLVQYDYSYNRELKKYGLIVFLPTGKSTGSYKLSVFGNLRDAKKVTEKLPHVFDITITKGGVSSKQKAKPIVNNNRGLFTVNVPDFSHLYLKNSFSNHLKLKLVSHKTQFIRSTGPLAQPIRIEFHSNTSLLLNLIDLDEDRSIEGGVFEQEHFDNQRVFHVALPKPNRRYKLELYAKLDPTEPVFSYLTDFYVVKIFDEQQVIQSGTKRKPAHDFKFVQMHNLEHSAFYIEEPICQDLAVSTVHTFRVCLQKRPLEVALKEVATNKWFYFMQDEDEWDNDADESRVGSMWSLEMDFKVCGELVLTVKYEEGNNYKSLASYNVVHKR
jgi:hypothetical protein